jgi:DNA-binding response OmpR family regulator
MGAREYAAPSGTAVRRGERVKLLIAHGDAHSRDVLRELARDLIQLGLEPVESGEGTHTMSLLLAANAPDLAVVDWDLPGCGGPELCRRVRAQRRSRPPYIILLAASDEQIGEAFEAGADDCIEAAAGGHALQARIVAARRLAALS